MCSQTVYPKEFICTPSTKRRGAVVGLRGVAMKFRDMIVEVGSVQKSLRVILPSRARIFRIRLWVCYPDKRITNAHLVRSRWPVSLNLSHRAPTYIRGRLYLQPREWRPSKTSGHHSKIISWHYYHISFFGMLNQGNLKDSGPLSSWLVTRDISDGVRCVTWRFLSTWFLFDLG